MKLRPDDKETFPGIPLEGHVCSLRQGKRKLYWRVEELIKESQSLPVRRMTVSELLPRIQNGSWFDAKEQVTIGKVLPHVRRILDADLSFPLILAADGRIMDGSHRLAAASIRGIEHIDVVQFEQDPLPGYTGETEQG